MYEFAHQQWPDAKFDFFLAHMREFNDEAYLPSPYFGIKTEISPDDVTPPPAKSYVANERGFAMLRMEESPKYWTSPSPAVALQFSELYVHYVADSFSLLGYVSKNRPIYVNRPISSGYNGGSYDFHVRAHCGVVVDGLQAQPIGQLDVLQDLNRNDFKYIRIDTPEGGRKHYSGKELRSSDQPKIGATHVYPNTDLSRQLVLAEDYMIDVFHVKSDKERLIHWLVHPLGSARPKKNAGWEKSDALQKNLFDVPEIKIGPSYVRQTSEDWGLSVVQDATMPLEETRLGKEWYEREVGVKVLMLGEAGTNVWRYEPPLEYEKGYERSRKARRGQPPIEPLKTPEYGGVSIAVERKAQETTFFALHVPFEGGKSPVESFTKIGGGDGYVDVQIKGEGIDDKWRVFIGGTKKVAEQL